MVLEKGDFYVVQSLSIEWKTRTGSQCLFILNSLIWRICRIEQSGINAIKFEAARIHFLSDFFVAVAVVVSLAEVPESGTFLKAQTVFCCCCMYVLFQDKEDN